MISGYDTSARGELLVSTFTAGMHPINPMSGHILPVIFFFHFGEQMNDVGHAGKGGLDPDEFWHAWARGTEMTVDIFDPKWSVWDWVEHDLEELRRLWNVTPGEPALEASLRNHPHHLILRSTPQACVSKDGQRAVPVPCFETVLRSLLSMRMVLITPPGWRRRRR